MTNQEAKFILRAYRPSGRDACDPQFQDALEQTKHDPELAKWFAEERALDARLAEKLRGAIPIPTGLKAELLAARKILRPLPWWQRQPWLAAAAAVVLLIAAAGVSLWPRGPRQFAAFRDAMVTASFNRDPHITTMLSDVNAIKQWLAQQGFKGEIVLPMGLRTRPAAGCRILDWRGHKVSLICFHTGASKHVDLFVIDEADLPGVLLQGTPRFEAHGGLMTASWRQSGKVYFLAGAATQADLQQLL
ncbi:MAG: hypothetical protein HYY24_23725 [Verrucomicrobia bacterium]|nr:hypothetical protein [Verrucomicrobiota bacterium]